ncbi:MAG TPA: hypothetical protein VLC10_04880 [Patescibacteria group bacterium]|nr:hypothetical protein [Patescibacteria group bacterium]
MRMAKTTIIAIAAAAAFGAALVAAGMTLQRAGERWDSRQQAIAASDRDRAELRRRIDALGTAAAYAELKRDSSAEGVAERHGKAHVFGELAYAKDGIGGIRACDADMSFGCYHGLIVKALAAEGIGALQRIDAACVYAYGPDDTGCRHGIGHGLVEYYGPRDLADALGKCAMLRPPGLLGCTQGVFMEFATAAEDEPALADPSRPDLPCSAVPAEFRPSCYFEQPYFLRLRLGYDGAAAAARCDALADATERRACLLGYGRSAAELGGYRAAGVTAACDALGPEDRPACYAGAHWLYEALGKAEPDPSFCEASGDAAGCIEAAAAIK